VGRREATGSVHPLEGENAIANDRVRKAVQSIRSLLVAALLCLAWSSAASAHANLVSSEPAEGSVLAISPQRLTLTFNESVEPLVLRIVDPAGQISEISDIGVRGNTVAFAAPQTLGTGTHLLSWRVVSADGHPVGGTLTFSVGKVTEAPQIAGDQPDLSVRVAIFIARVVIFLGLFVGVGGAFFIAWFAQSELVASARPPIVIASLAALIAIPISVGLLGLDAVAASFPALMQRAIWIAGLQTAYGPTAIAACVSLLLAIISFGSSGTPAKWLTFVSLSAVGLALALSGHAASATPRLLTVPAIFCHAVAIAFWIGALLPLMAALRSGNKQAAAIVTRFSSAIPFTILPLAISGLALAVVQLTQVEALWSTTYGRLLSAKLALLAMLFALAAVNRWVLTPGVINNDPRAMHRMRRTIAAEIVLAVLIVGVVSFWRFTPPPRALAQEASMFMHIHTARAMADVTITPARAGPVTLDIAVRTAEEAPLDPMEIAVTAANSQAGIEPITRQARRIESGQWRVSGLPLSALGSWDIELKLLVTDFDLVTLRTSIVIAR
jgi:copper transport protein